MLQQEILEKQKELIQQQKDLIQEQLNAGRQAAGANIGAGGTEATPNADEWLIARNDLGQKAVDGAMQLVEDVLSGVSDFLDNLFDGSSK